jgi:hypothetical protein
MYVPHCVYDEKKQAQHDVYKNRQYETPVGLDGVNLEGNLCLELSL